MLHNHGSNNPNGISSNGDRLAMHPYFTFKDLVTFFLFFLVLSVIVFYYPNLLGELIFFMDFIQDILNTAVQLTQSLDSLSDIEIISKCSIFFFSSNFI